MTPRSLTQSFTLTLIAAERGAKVVEISLIYNRRV
jgi:hypothetical protein